MSLGIYPVFKPKLTGTEFDAVGEALAANFEALNEIARAASLTPITSFADSRSFPEDFDGDPEELAEIMGEWTEWFDPAEGQAATQALDEHIKNNPAASNQLEDPDWVMTELEELSRILGVAASQGLQFRLEMS